MNEAFVYCWTDNLDNKLYVGVHKGSEDDGYISTSKYLNAKYSERPETFSRTVIAHGTYKEMINLEHHILKSAGAAKSNHFYNKCNGRSGFLCNGHTEKSRKKMSRSWIRKGVFNCNNQIAIAAWRGSNHTEESKRNMSEGQKKHTKKRSDHMKKNNPMSSPESIARMLETRKRNRELKNGASD